MLNKNSERLDSGSLVAFIILCTIWFLELCGLLSGIIQGI
jgi:hypothetical protein